VRADASRNQAFIKLEPLIALAAVAVALGSAIYSCKGAPPEHPLSAKIIRFEVTSEPDDARTPPIRESLAATVEFVNGGGETKTITRARFLVSGTEDLSDPRSWSTVKHRNSRLLDLKIPPGESITHTFIIPWTGREETRYFPDGARVHLGLEVSSNALGGEPVTLTERFGHLVQRNGRIVNSDHRLLVLEFPRE
jgi:hypothetical protein